MLNTGSERITSEHGLLTTIAWQLGDTVTYALEGAVFIAGALIQWLRDGLELFEDAAQTEALATAVADSGGVYIVPAFVGLGAPHWDPYARGTIVGLTRDTNRNHMVRAALEAIAFQSAEVLRSMASDTGQSLSVLRIDGGASANNFLCQFQADLLGLPVTRPQVIETTAMGAAFLAGLATGVWRDQEQIQTLWQEDRTFTPQLERNVADARLAEWSRAVERAKGWIPSTNL
jgi:glycerol kinase